MRDYSAELNAGTESTVSVPTVHPWVRYPICPKCRSALAGGIKGLRWILSADGRDAQNYGWCKGDHNSTIKINANLGGMTIGQAELPVECFGIFVEHLHVNCRRCGYRWLMECAPLAKSPFPWKDFRKGFAIVLLGWALLLLLLTCTMAKH